MLDALLFFLAVAYLVVGFGLASFGTVAFCRSSKFYGFFAREVLAVGVLAAVILTTLVLVLGFVRLALFWPLDVAWGLRR
jgi:hypothetical protein